MRLKLVKKSLILGTAATVSMLSMTSVQAQNGEAYLSQIATNTGNANTAINAGNTATASALGQISTTATSILGALNTQIQNFQTYYIATIFPELYSFMQSWLAPDNTQTTASVTTTMEGFGTYITNNATPNQTLLAQINHSFFGSNTSSLKNTIWYANDLAYSTLLGYPVLSPDPRAPKIPGLDPAYNYVLNASGAGVNHVRPYTSPTDPSTPMTWSGNTRSQQRYQNYYNTVAAVASYDAYVLGGEYSEVKNAKNNPPFTQLQTNLIAEVSDPTGAWFTQLAGKESLGQVIRQLLLFESQVFVLMTQMVEIQRQSLNAQVMTNALLIATNVDKEYALEAYAQGTTPKP